MASADELKKMAALKAIEKIKDGMIVGLGTGSTAAHAVRGLAERIEKESLTISAIPTSERTRELAEELGITLITLEQCDVIDLTIDGADEVDDDFQLIKGGGGALLREKIVAAASKRFIVIVDARKRVTKLGSFPLPVEVVPFGKKVVSRQIRQVGGIPQLRRSADGEPFVTDEGNYILDCQFGAINDPRALAATISQITGVVEHGLFIDMVDAVIVGRDEGIEVLDPLDL